jgi:hypothetical protein
MEKRSIYFNEELHKYTDELNNQYISTTTIISNYYEKFKTEELAEACARIGRNPSHPKYLKYKGKSKKQIIIEWDTIKNVACNKGNIKHNYFEEAIRKSTGYKLINNIFINDKIYTLDDVIGDRKIGLLSIEQFEAMGIKQRYPSIFNIIYDLTKLGYLIYAEIGVYDSKYLVSGLIDVILIKGNHFIIIDWKTNSAPIRFESGYFEKDNYGNRTEKWIDTNDNFYFPIDYISASIGNKYSMQVSGYVEMAELFGLIYDGSVLFHIRTLPNKGMISKINEIEEKEEVKQIKVIDFRNEFKKIKEHNFNLHHFEQINTLF